MASLEKCPAVYIDLTQKGSSVVHLPYDIYITYSMVGRSIASIYI